MRGNTAKSDCQSGANTITQENKQNDTPHKRVTFGIIFVGQYSGNRSLAVCTIVTFKGQRWRRKISQVAVYLV